MLFCWLVGWLETGPHAGLALNSISQCWDYRLKFTYFVVVVFSSLSFIIWQFYTHKQCTLFKYTHPPKEPPTPSCSPHAPPAYLPSSCPLFFLVLVVTHWVQSVLSIRMLTALGNSIVIIAAVSSHDWPCHIPQTESHGLRTPPQPKAFTSFPPLFRVLP